MTQASSWPHGARATPKPAAFQQIAVTQRLEIFFDAVTDLVIRGIDRVVSPQTVSLKEDERGDFVACASAGLRPANGTSETDSDQAFGTLPKINVEAGTLPATAQLAGSRVELMLSASRCLFCPLELPCLAAEFLGGIVRAQIDRLTPWHAPDAAFGWSAPIEIEGGRLTTTIAATPLASIKPLLNSFFAKGVRSVAVSVAAPGADGPPIRIWEQRAPDALQAGRIRKLLVAMLATAAILAGGAVGAAAIGRSYLEADYEQRDNEINRLRAAVSGNATVGSAAGAQRALVQRKLAASSAVMIIEALAKLLPDHTHVIELRLEENKLRLIGQTRDAASLIGLIEQSGQFKHATFFAPTTRSTSESGERFHIEVTVQLASAPRL